MSSFLMDGLSLKREERLLIFVNTFCVALILTARALKKQEWA
jgi:hypothetical protein